MRTNGLGRAGWLILGVVTAVAVGCGGGKGRGADGGRDGGADAGGDAATCDAGCAAWPPPASSPTEPAALVLETVDWATVGTRFPVGVRAPDGWTGPVTVTDGITEKDVRLYRGAGSLLWEAGEEDFTLIVGRGSTTTVGMRTVKVVTRPTRTFDGTLAGDDLQWDGDSLVVIHGRAVVPAGKTLSLAAGTHVALGPKATLEVRGRLVASGTADAPVLFHAEGDGPWSELEFVAGSEGTFEHALITSGGGDASRVFGHSGTEPVIRATAATIVLRHSIVADNPGKAFGTQGARVTLEDTITTRSDSGGEFKKTLLHMRRTHNVEIPDADGVFDDDDNDGVYLHDAFEGEAGDEYSVLTQVVFANGEDDAIDHNGGLVRVDGAFISGFRHEGVAGSSERQIEIHNADISHCDQGIEAGYGATKVFADHVYVHDNGTGLRVGDSYDWESTSTLTVRDSVIARNDTDVRNFVVALDGPNPGALSLTCTWVSDDTGTDLGECNREGEPETSCDPAGTDCKCETPAPVVCPAPND